MRDKITANTTLVFKNFGFDILENFNKNLHFTFSTDHEDKKYYIHCVEQIDPKYFHTSKFKRTINFIKEKKGNFIIVSNKVHPKLKDLVYEDNKILINKEMRIINVQKMLNLNKQLLKLSES